MPVTFTRNLKAPRSRGGFSLVELLVVMAIIAALAALLTPAYFGVRKTVFEGNVSSELNQYAAMVEKFRDEYGFYPPDFSEFVAANGTTLNFTDVIPFSGGVTVQQRLLQYLQKISPTHNEMAPEPTDTTAPIRSRLEHWYEEVGRRLASDTTIAPATKVARLRGPQFAIWFWLTRLYNDAQYPLSGQRLGTTNADSNGNGVPDWGEIVSQWRVMVEIAPSQLKQETAAAYQLGFPLAFNVTPFAVLRVIQSGGDGPVCYFHHATYLDNSGAMIDPAIATSIDYAPGATVLNIARPVRVPGSLLTAGQFIAPNTFQIMAPGWDESYGEVNTNTPECRDNICDFSEGRLDVYVEQN
jgi:prepilin-type N-terminal cleavage/methylation domain-containing protein